MIALDTATSPSGRITAYEWGGNPIFRPENHIRISNSPFFAASTTLVSDRTDAGALEGLFAIGEIIEPGLSEEAWHSLFSPNSVYWSDITADPPIAGTENAYSAYGLPDRPFDNSTKLLNLEEIQWAETAVVRYDPSDGRVTLDTSGATSGYISRFALESPSHVFFAEDYQSPVTDALLSMADGMFLVVISDVITPGEYDLGRVMQPGLARDEFIGLFDYAGFNTRAQSEAGVFDLVVNDVGLSLVYLPEPSVGFLLGVCITLLPGRHRRVDA